MHLPFEYMLKISLCLTVTYLFYVLLLKRITHYSWNRLFLLTCSVLAFIIPALNINLFVEPEKLTGVFFVNKIPAINTDIISSNISNGSVAWNMSSLLLIIFITGVCFFSGRLIIQFISLKKIQAKAQLINNGEVKLYHLNAGIAPFTFYKSIYLDKNIYNEQELDEVIKHELVHVNQKHTIDVLLAELLCILNWYNPFAWMIKHAVKENLEFIADDIVLQNGVNRKDYQYLLLKVTGNIPCTVTSNLNFSSLKKRIQMMNGTKTSKAHLFKFLFIVPMLSILLLAFRHAYDKPVVHRHSDATALSENYILESLTYSITDPKIEALVKKEQGNSYLKQGDTLSLSMIKNEKERLLGILQKNGYSNLGTHAITFEVDTTLGNKRFSVQVNITAGQNKSSVHSGQNQSSKANVTSYYENKQYDRNAFDNRSSMAFLKHVNNVANA